MSILDERTCIAVEVDRLLRVEEHCLLRVDLEDEVLQCSKADHSEESILLLGRKVVDLAELHRSLLGGVVHVCNEVVSINYCSLA